MVFLIFILVSIFLVLLGMSWLIIPLRGWKSIVAALALAVAVELGMVALFAYLLCKHFRR